MPELKLMKQTRVNWRIKIAYLIGNLINFLKFLSKKNQHLLMQLRISAIPDFIVVISLS